VVGDRDLARRDADGWYWFVGRRKEIIIRGASNIAPGEIESVLASILPSPPPASSAPRRTRRPRPVAFAAPSRRHRRVDALRAFAAERLAEYKVPVRISLLDALPLNVNGKVDRRAGGAGRAGAAMISVADCSAADSPVRGAVHPLRVCYTVAQAIRHGRPTSYRRVFLFSGHLIDAPDRPTPRFPADKEPSRRRPSARPRFPRLRRRRSRHLRRRLRRDLLLPKRCWRAARACSCCCRSTSRPSSRVRRRRRPAWRQRSTR
jgi:hypothetical protein